MSVTRLALGALIGMVCGADLVTTLVGFRVGLRERNPLFRWAPRAVLFAASWLAAAVALWALCASASVIGVAVLVAALACRVGVVLRNWRLLDGRAWGRR